MSEPPLSESIVNGVQSTWISDSEVSEPLVGVDIVVGTVLTKAPTVFGVEVVDHPFALYAETLATIKLLYVYEKGALVKVDIGIEH
jgi:hypothetical protein